MSGENRRLGHVKVDCGKLVLTGYNSCEIFHNDEFINYTGPNELVIPELKFGLINYSCDNVANYLISPVDCKNCNYSCPQEQSVIARYGKENVQVWSGVTVAIIFTTVVCSIFHKFIFKATKFKRRNSCSYLVEYTKKKKSFDENAHTGIDNEGFEDENGDGPRLPGNSFEMEDVWIGLKREERLKNMPSKKKSFGAFSLLLTKTGSTACDWKVFTRDSNVTMICNSPECPDQDSSPYSFSPRLGQEICFVDNHPNIFMSATISEITLRARYEHVFNTPDFNSSTTVLSHKCEKNVEAEACPRVNHDCDADNITKLNEKIVKSENVLEGWSCDAVKYVSPAPGQVCCYFSWKIEKTDSFSVLRKVGHVWIVQLALSWNDNTQKKTIKLSSFEPFFNLGKFGSSSIDQMPISVVDAVTDKSKSHRPDYLLLHNGIFYYVNSSEINMPFQDMRNFTDALLKSGPVKEKCYEPDSSRTNCECECKSIIKNNISEFRSNLHNNFRFADHFVIRTNNLTVIDVFEKLDDATVTIQIDDGNNQNAANGKCDIELAFTYGSTSSKESSYIVLTSRNVKKEGLVQLISNCSFDSRYVKCDEYEPMKLKLKEKRDYCNVTVPTLNQTIVIHFEYFHLEQPNLYLTDSLENFSRTFKGVVISENFIKAFFVTVLLLSVCILIVLALRRFLSKHSYQYPQYSRLIQF